jgi:hypothetical protein
MHRFADKQRQAAVEGCRVSVEFRLCDCWGEDYEADSIRGKNGFSGSQIARVLLISFASKNSRRFESNQGHKELVAGRGHSWLKMA